jgi:uncharacterized protein
MIAVMSQDRFWERKRLFEMTEAEWESLCDGCGRCCLVKLEDEDTGEIYPTTVACHMLDGATCRCKDYANRQHLVPDCIKFDPANVSRFSWVPRSCAYRRLAEGRGLAWWHPLVSGTPDTVVAAGISCRNRSLSEEGIAEEDLGDYITDWPDWK